MTEADWMRQHYEASGATSSRACRAVTAHVEPGSPADDAGLRVGMALTQVEGHPLSDIIEWRWWADGFTVEVTLEDGRVVEIERDLGQDWGIEFADVVFDGLRTCVNNCTFCFMRMLPKGMRKTLYVRDDDYRLSFLQGNFVTLTNLSDDDVERIVTYGLSPLHVSLHAVSPDVREKLMGRNAARGMEVLERLLDAGIEVHTQIVVVPGVNDGVELVRTLGWIEAHPQVLSCGIVPLGYTKYQDRFTSSFSDDPDAAAAVIELVREMQEDSGREQRNTYLQLSDEFYLDAGYPFPPARFYAGYPQFQDGIGMMRAFLDEWAENGALVKQQARALEGKPPVTVVTGTAFAGVLGPLVDASPLAAHVVLLPVENAFFGGNVDVTCLLTGADIVPALQAAGPAGPVIMARQLFNDSGALLDDVTLDDIERRCRCTVRLCTYSAVELLEALT